jgi:glycerol-3-phosphate dehydrogenase
LDRYGSEVGNVLAVGLDRPELLLPVPGADDYLMAEVHHAATHEGALHLDDLLGRRTRISIETEHRGVDSAQAVAELVGPVLGWDDAQVEHEVQSYYSRVAAERASQEESHDGAAISRRLTAVDSRKVAPSPA